MPTTWCPLTPTIDTARAATSSTSNGATTAAMGSLSRREGCGYCGAAQCEDGKPLLKCGSCRVAAYCDQEHQKFDWKRHKVICKTVQLQKEREQAEEERLRGEQQPETSNNHIDHPIYPKTASSEKLIATDDPDIQIIETPNMPPPPTPSAQRNLKRTSNEAGTNGKVYKDHSKNLLFKTTLQEHLKSLAASGMAVNQHQAIALRLKYIAEHVIRSLNEYGWCAVDNFLGITHCRHTFQEVDRLFQRGVFTAGQLMEKKAGAAPHDIRSDEIYWFDSGDERAIDAVTVRLLVSMIDSVIVHFAGRIPPYKISGRSRAMIACYPGNGTRYVKHVDNPIKDGRCITSIYYCNENWDLAQHGGTLRLYPETSASPMDVDPQGDRLVFFWSDRRNPHEVLPVYRHRFAITIWYFDESEKTAAIDRLKAEEARASADTRPPPATRAKVDETVVNGSATDLPKSASDTKLVDTATPPGDNQPDKKLFGSLPDISRAYREMHFNRMFADYPPESTSTDSDEPPAASPLDPEYQI